MGCVSKLGNHFRPPLSSLYFCLSVLFDGEKGIPDVMESKGVGKGMEWGQMGERWAGNQFNMGVLE